MKTIYPAALLSKVTTFLSAMFLVSACAHAAIDIDQQPLLVTKPVPGNMAIIGSFEFPTMVTRAHKQGDYNAGTTYAGYFDSKKYYQYKFDTDEKKRHFFPVRFKTSAKQSDDWDGNFLNWATMQSIDIFRQVLTG